MPTKVQPVTLFVEFWLDFAADGREIWHTATCIDGVSTGNVSTHLSRDEARTFARSQAAMLRLPWLDI